MSVTTQNKDISEALINAVSFEGITSGLQQRKRSFEEFQKIGLPHSKSEEYKFTPITKLISQLFDANELTLPTPTESAPSHLIPKDFKDNCVVFVNGYFNKELSNFNTDGNVLIKPLAQAIADNPDLVGKYLSQVDLSKDPFTLLNSTVWQDGLFVHVLKNSTNEKPLFIYHLHEASQSKVVSHTRLLVLVEQGAAFSIVEQTNSTGENSQFNTITEEIVVQENASFDYFKIQNDPGQLIQVANTTVHQHNSSRTNTYTFSLNGKLLRNNLNIIIDGEGCESHFYGLYLMDGDTLVDNHTTVDHKKPNSFSNELYKGLMDGKSKGVFNGKIFVRPHAQKTNAFQSNRNILLSDTATVNSKPQLEIWADDVKCSHGCTSGQLDDEALFYLQSRGIPKATAKAMLLYAFAGEVLDVVKDEKLRTYIDSIISERLHKAF